MVTFRDEVMSEVVEINKPIQKLRMKLTKCLNTSQNRTGLLKHSENDYMKSVQLIDVEELQDTLSADLNTWKEELKKVTIAA